MAGRRTWRRGYVPLVRRRRGGVSPRPSFRSGSRRDGEATFAPVGGARLVAPGHRGGRATPNGQGARRGGRPSTNARRPPPRLTLLGVAGGARRLRASASPLAQDSRTTTLAMYATKLATMVQGTARGQLSLWLRASYFLMPPLRFFCGFLLEAMSFSDLCIIEKENACAVVTASLTARQTLSHMYRKLFGVVLCIPLGFP